MYYLLMQQEVTDYEKWRAVFDSMESVRRTNGARSEMIFRDADNPQAVTLLITWDNHESAKNWMSDPRLKGAMKEAGVLGPPTLTYLIQS